MLMQEMKGFSSNTTYSWHFYMDIYIYYTFGHNLWAWRGYSTREGARVAIVMQSTTSVSRGWTRDVEKEASGEMGDTCGSLTCGCSLV